MKNQTLFILWAADWALCLGMGFLPQSTGFSVAARLLIALSFFVIPFVLLSRGLAGNRKILRSLRLISGLSLLLTFAALVASFLSVLASETLGDLLHILLNIVSVPMLCSGYWVVSLFLWAALFFSTFLKKKPAKP